ncbi:hypothetical protein AC1031_011932 [Aphanomyces cochlioides]|nr:hypothetical protein AC1031_011932 [Aphanomyces cochlioides]
MVKKVDEGYAKMQRKIRKRGYMRQFMQIYRGREKEEVASLKQQIADLEAELAMRLTKTTISGELAWRDVAIAMDEMRKDGVLEQKALIDDTNETREVGLDLYGWVASFCRPLASPNPRCQTWRDVSLLSHPRSRQLGKEWITQHMYHNANRVFEVQDLPPPFYNIIDNSWDIDFSGECYYVIERGQLNWAMPLEKVRSMFRNHMCSMFTLDSFYPLSTNTLTEATDNTVLHQLVPDKDRSSALYVNLLGGEFNEADRSVLVITQIQDDELVSINASLAQRSRMTWVELYRESDLRTRGRYVSIVSQQFTKNGYISMADEARGWGYDLSQVPEWEQERLFLQLHRQRNEALKSSRQRWYSAIIDQEMKEHDTTHASVDVVEPPVDSV